MSKDKHDPMAEDELDSQDFTIELQLFAEHYINASAIEDVEAMRYGLKTIKESIRAYTTNKIILELRQLKADTLEPEQVGGKFIHEANQEFANQLKEFIDDRIKALNHRKDD